jgi:ATP-dependent Clp protease ATP-binding subunit ClpC
MSEGFTDRFRKVMQLANQEAQRFNHEYIATEHILLGLIKEYSNNGAQLLKHLGIDFQKIRFEVEKVVEVGPDMVAMGMLPQTPAAKKAISLASEAAKSRLRRRDQLIGTEHLLLGLIEYGDGLAFEVLNRLGVTEERVLDAAPGVLGDLLEGPNPASFLLDPGTATAEEIGNLFFEISKLYRMIGGSGVRFTVEDCRLPQMSEER